MCKLLLNIVFHLRSSLLSKQWNNIFLLAWVSVVTYKNPPQNDVLAAIASQLVSYAVAWFSLVIRAQCVCFALYILFFRMQGFCVFNCFCLPTMFTSYREALPGYRCPCHEVLFQSPVRSCPGSSCWECRDPLRSRWQFEVFRRFSVTWKKW